jgi:hypothetical protein
MSPARSAGPSAPLAHAQTEGHSTATLMATILLAPGLSGIMV